MEGGDGHAREGGEQCQQQWPPWPGPVLRLTCASQKQPPQPARYDERPVQQPHAQEREVRVQLEMLNTIITKNGSNERQFSQETLWTSFTFMTRMHYSYLILLGFFFFMLLTCCIFYGCI